MKIGAALFPICQRIGKRPANVLASHKLPPALSHLPVVDVPVSVRKIRILRRNQIGESGRTVEVNGCVAAVRVSAL